MINKFIYHPERLKPYILGGRTTFTLVSTKLNKRYTYYITQDNKMPERYFVKVMHGSDNTAYNDGYHFLGWFYADTFRLKMGNQSDGHQRTDAAKMFDYFLDIVEKRRPWPDTCEFYASTHCARCGRKLTTPESIAKGIGPDCLEALGSAGKAWRLDLETDEPGVE